MRPDPCLPLVGRAATALLLCTSPALAQFPLASAVGPRGGAAPAPPTSPPSAGPGAPTQELYVHDPAGPTLYRVDDYATNPTVVPVAASPWLTDLAFDPATGLMYSVTFGVGSLFHTYDAAFNPTVVFDDPAIPYGNALEYGPDGTLWVRSATSTGLWEVDPATGIGTWVANMPAPSAGDIAVDRDGRVLTANTLGEIDVYDPATGTVSSLGPHGLGSNVYGLEMDRDGTLYAILDYGQMYTIDLATMTPTFVANLGVQVFGCSFVLPAEPEVSIGTSYCGPAVPNSSGLPGVIAATGSVLVVDDDVTLTASDLPPNQFGYFLNSQTQGFVANPGGSQGNLCLGGAIGRYNRPGEVASSGAAGSFALALELTDTPQPGGPVSIQPGETWNFTAWFRDQNPGVTSNFTDAVSIDFQ